MFILQILATIICAGFALWVFGGIYYDVAQRARWGWAPALIWLVAVTLILVLVRPYWLALVIVLALCLLFLAWWLTQKPSHDRNWEPNFATLPRFTIAGDTLTCEGVRNTQYLSADEYEVQTETRQYSLENLRGMDVLILFWGSNLMCHPIALFDFGDNGYLCFSIEVRYRRGENYSTLRNIYRQNEIMMVVCDERDAILMRTRFSDVNELYLYRMQEDAEFARDFLDRYIKATNDVYDNPRWYNLVTWNCTTTIYWMRRDTISWDWRMLLNGNLDRMMYDWGRLFREIPFEELKQTSLINERANAASQEGFSREIREGLPGFDESDMQG
ncbi:MAG: DUF4105 domain-containing protein [Pirellulaceae bacterium]